MALDLDRSVEEFGLVLVSGARYGPLAAVGEGNGDAVALASANNGVCALGQARSDVQLLHDLYRGTCRGAEVRVAAARRERSARRGRRCGTWFQAQASSGSARVIEEGAHVIRENAGDGGVMSRRRGEFISRSVLGGSAREAGDEVVVVLKLQGAGRSDDDGTVDVGEGRHVRRAGEHRRVCPATRAVDARGRVWHRGEHRARQVDDLRAVHFERRRRRPSAVPHRGASVQEGSVCRHAHAVTQGEVRAPRTVRRAPSC